MADAGMASDGIEIRTVVRDVVTELAAEELPVLAGLAELHEPTALRRMARLTPRQDSLGFGLDEIGVLVTPVVWLAVNEAARRIGATAGNGVAAGAKGIARKVLGKRQRRRRFRL